MDFATLARLPDPPADGADLPRSRIQVAVLANDFTDPRYGDFAITHDDVANWQRLLGSVFGGRVHIDADHGTDYGIGDGSRAAGWILALDHMGPDGQTDTPDEVWATVEWTPLGQQRIRDREYLWISPTFTDDYIDNRGNHHGPALARAGLTNDPFLREMAMLSLSGGVLAHRRAHASGGRADSRRAMPELTKIAEALGLNADADEPTVLSAIGTLADQATKANDPATLLAAAPIKTLTDALKEQGLVALTAAEHAELKADALAGKSAAEDLRVTKFEQAYEKALHNPAGPQVDTSEETKTEWRQLFDAAPEVALKRLAALPPLVSLAAKGHGGSGDGPDLSGEGYEDGQVDDDRAAVLVEARKLAAEKNLDIATAARMVLARAA